MNVIETSRFLIGDFFDHVQPKTFLWDKKNKKGFVQQEYVNPPFGDFNYAKDNILVNIWNNDFITSFKNNLASNPEFRSQQNDYIINVVENYNDEDDNPILILYYLND